MPGKNTNFVGRTKVIETQYGELVKIAFGPLDFEKLEANRKNGWCNLVMKRSATKGEPYLVFDDFVPKKKEEQAQEEPIKERGYPGEDTRPKIEDVPF